MVFSKHSLESLLTRQKTIFASGFVRILSHKYFFIILYKSFRDLGEMITKDSKNL